MMTAAAKPKIISCACHHMPGIGVCSAPEKTTTQIGTAIAAKAAASR